MARSLSDQLLSQLSKFVANQMGLHFPPERWGDLERGIRSVAGELGAPNAEACAQQIMSKPLAKNQIEVLASALTVGETYFFRDKRSFEILVERALPGLIRTRQGIDRQLRIWSAGCCTGEEAYSIAILLDQELPEARNWHITILGTDINPRSIEKAADGVFGEWSFRDPPRWLKQSYFKQVGSRRFEILPRIKKMVTFGYLNLADDVYPSLCNNTNAMDLIFCRNVLMYFSPERVEKVVHNLHRSLVDSGWLVVSAVEASAQLFSQFLREHSDGAVLYRKVEKPSRSSTALAQDKIPDAPRFRRDISSSTSAPVFSPPSPQRAEAISPTAEQIQTAKNERTLWAEGLALLEQGNYSEAVRKLKAGCTPAHPAPGMSTVLARACANSGELAEACQWAEKAVSADKLNPALHYLRAVILQEQGAAEEAVASLHRALYLDPEFVLAHYALGNHKLRQRKFKEAGKHFTNALVLLAGYQRDAVLPHSDGLAAGRLREIIESTKYAKQAT